MWSLVSIGTPLTLQGVRSGLGIPLHQLVLTQSTILHLAFSPMQLKFFTTEPLHNQTSAWVFIKTSWCSMSCFLMCYTAVSCSWLHAIFMLHCPVGQPLPLCCFVNAFYRTTFFIVLLTGNAFPVTPLNHLQPKMLLYASQA